MWYCPIKAFGFCKTLIRVYIIRKYIRDCYIERCLWPCTFTLCRSAKVELLDVCNVDTLILAHVIRNRDIEKPIEQQERRASNATILEDTERLGS
jgi:hypothetical protein